MIFVLRIMGGLGNQLFQYATMRYLNIKYPDSEMYIDSRGYNNYKLRNYELKSFQLIDNIKDYTKSPLWYTLSRESYHLYQYLYNRFNSKKAPMLSQFFINRGLMYAIIDYEMPENLQSDILYIYGYFGKLKYINEIQKELQRDIQLKDRFSQLASSYSNSISAAINPVGVSIRYGKDYQKLGWPICSPKYYRSAMNRIQHERGQCKFFVFSDEMKTVIDEKWFEGFDVEYVDGCSVAESFMLLRSCHDFVIPNSSFSWWAAWLSENPKRIVYAPDKFYSGKSHGYDMLIAFEQERFLNHITGERI